ncbi:TPA: hypothetical protein EYP44_04195 [Candidatus Bathyarchaeota archaeon]|nr:hypothetical protein [Candidatus Bathyarchaeota archaeon]
MDTIHFLGITRSEYPKHWSLSEHCDMLEKPEEERINWLKREVKELKAFCTVTAPMDWDVEVTPREVPSTYFRSDIALKIKRLESKVLSRLTEVLSRHTEEIRREMPPSFKIKLTIPKTTIPRDHYIPIKWVISFDYKGRIYDTRLLPPKITERDILLAEGLKGPKTRLNKELSSLALTVKRLLSSLYKVTVVPADRTTEIPREQAALPRETKKEEGVEAHRSVGEEGMTYERLARIVGEQEVTEPSTNTPSEESVRCGECGIEVPESEIIRCYDCGRPLCKECGSIGLCPDCEEAMDYEDYVDWLEEDH